MSQFSRCRVEIERRLGIKPGVVQGETDDYGYDIVHSPVHIHDLNATILHCLGFDHERLTYRFQGREEQPLGAFFSLRPEVRL